MLIENILPGSYILYNSDSPSTGKQKSACKDAIKPATKVPTLCNILIISLCNILIISFTTHLSCSVCAVSSLLCSL